MATYPSYENDMERKQHCRAIQILAGDLSVPEEEMQRIYETMLCELKERARIKDCLAILASRNVRDMVNNGFNHNLMSRPRETVERIVDDRPRGECALPDSLKMTVN